MWADETSSELASLLNDAFILKRPSSRPVWRYNLESQDDPSR